MQTDHITKYNSHTSWLALAFVFLFTLWFRMFNGNWKTAKEVKLDLDTLLCFMCKAYSNPCNCICLNVCATKTEFHPKVTIEMGSKSHKIRKIVTTLNQILFNTYLYLGKEHTYNVHISFARPLGSNLLILSEKIIIDVSTV